MQWLWTWKGRCFGYRDGNDLWTHDGKHVGRFADDDAVYGTNGRYLGEIRNEKFLITHIARKNQTNGSFTPYASKAAYAKYADYAGYAMYAGYEEFPTL